MNRTYTLLLIIIAFALSGCTSSIKLVGEVNMISTRNINTSLNYKQLTSYSGGNNRQLKKSKSKNIHQAVNETVKTVPGGEFLMNAKIYIVDNKYYAIEGDVWGQSVSDGDYNGFKLGDKVMWGKFLGGYSYGTIVAIKNTEECIVEDENGKKIAVKYEKLMHSKNDE